MGSHGLWIVVMSLIISTRLSLKIVAFRGCISLRVVIRSV